MITNFEYITKDLTEQEKSLVNILIKGFSNHKKENPIKEPEIVNKLEEKGIKITGARLRKLCNLIRVTGMIPLIATSKGYYVSYDQIEIKKQIKSLEERAASITAAADGLKTFINRTAHQGQLELREKTMALIQ